MAAEFPVDDEYFNQSVRLLKRLMEAGRLDSVGMNEIANLRVVRSVRTGQTILHVAADAGNVQVVDVLARTMREEQLEITDNEGFTALARVTCNGNRRLVEGMLRRNQNLISIQNDKGNVPAVAALHDGNLGLARYLYPLTKGKILGPENDIVGPTVLCEAIYNKALGKN